MLATTAATHHMLTEREELCAREKSVRRGAESVRCVMSAIEVDSEGMAVRGG